jgi:hypothetical protein
MLARNHVPGSKTLYLHWVDYHKRFWTMDYDFISGQAKSMGLDATDLAKSIYFIRAFSADSVETENNWRRIFRFGKGLNFAVLDSVSELYEDRPDYQKETSQKTQLYAIGMFSRLCMKNNCVGLVLDTSRHIHPYLGSVSSIILDLCIDDGVIASVIKHPMMERKSVKVASWGQQKLGRWLTCNQPN